MWETAIGVSTQRLTDALLRKPVLPQGGRAFEKVSAVIAVRTALNAAASQQTLAFLVPGATASTARLLTAALLVANYAHSNGNAQLPSDEVRALFKGDVLLVTAAVSECKSELDELPIVGSSQHLKDLWEVIPLSKYTKPRTNRPRVFLGNPGWMLASTTLRRFGAVVIDASHPRTYDRLSELLRSAIGLSSLRVVVSPLMNDSALRECGYPETATLWVWDPQAMFDAQALVEREDSAIYELGKRYLWVCDSDPVVSATMSKFYQQLRAAVKATAGRPYPGLQQCWSVYNRLRQLMVPLAQLEQITSRTWAGSLRQRIAALGGIGGHGDVGWETTWPPLVDAVNVTYQTFLKREETAKFWGVAANLAEFLASREEHLRIIIAADSERELLLNMLSDVVDGVNQAMAEGRFEMVTSSVEARLVAEGARCRTTLLGPRTQSRRHLDLFASRRVDEFVYPHEIDIERAAQTKLHDTWTRAAADDRRVKLLAPLGFTPLQTSKPRPVTGGPTLIVGTVDGRAVNLAVEAKSSDSFDIDTFLENLDQGNVEEDPSVQRFSSALPETGDVVKVVFTRSVVEQYYSNQKVDVYFSESGVVQRHPALALRPGWQVISFVDGRYDGLFARLTETIDARLPARERIALKLWRTAKEELLSRHEHKRLLYEKLQARGLQSSFEAFASWFEGEEGTLAPQQFDDFEVCARECETYKSDTLLRATFSAVQHARGRNRASGRLLRGFLRAVVSGDGYDEALESARKLDTALGDVLTAVEVREVVSVSVLQRNR